MSNLKLSIFRGVVAVTMDLLNLDINQCPGPYYAENAFEGTDKCDHMGSYVSNKYLL